MGGEPTPEPTIEPVKPKGLNPFDFVEDVTVNKRDIIRNSDNPEYMESGYNPWITNKTLSYFEDTIIYANEMNKYSFLSNQMQFDYFLKSINKRKRFSKQFKKVVTNDVTAVATYFGYSIRRAEQAIKFLTVNQIEEIKAKTNPGGVS
jgi:hypothetical protein